MTPPALAQELANKNSYEAKAVGAFLLYCLPALTAKDSVQRVAEMQKLPELSAPAEAAFLQGQPGKVFGLPEVGPGIVLKALDQPICSVLIQKLDPQEFVKQMDFWFDPSHSPFQIKENNTSPNGEINRKYYAEIGSSKILLIASVRSQPLAGGVQAMLTAGQTNGQ